MHSLKTVLQSFNRSLKCKNIPDLQITNFVHLHHEIQDGPTILAIKDIYMSKLDTTWCYDKFWQLSRKKKDV